MLSCHGEGQAGLSRVALYDNAKRLNGDGSGSPLAVAVLRFRVRPIRLSLLSRNDEQFFALAREIKLLLMKVLQVPAPTLLAQWPRCPLCCKS